MDEVVPLDLAHVWNIFTDLRDSAGSNGFSAAAISYQEIESYARLMGLGFEPWEVEVIKELDVLCRRIWSEPATDG